MEEKRGNIMSLANEKCNAMVDKAHFALSLLVAIFLASLTTHCTKAGSNSAENRPPSSRKDGETPDALPGYLIDRSFFGFSTDDKLYSDIIIAPFAAAQADGSVVVSLKEPPVDGEYAIALYGPPDAMNCATFVAEIASGVWSAETNHRQSRNFISISDSSLSADASSLTLFIDTSDGRLPCTALAVAEKLPLDAGYKGLNGNVAFLTVGLDFDPYTGFADSLHFVTNELSVNNQNGIWSQEFVEDGSTAGNLPVLRRLPREDGGWIAGTASSAIKERIDGTWQHRGSQSYSPSFGPERYAVADLVTWSHDGAEKVAAIAGFTDYNPNFDFAFQPSESSTFSFIRPGFNMPSLSFQVEGGKLSEQATYMTIVGRTSPRSLHLLKPRSDEYIHNSADIVYGGESCTSVGSETLSVSETGVTHFALACKQGTQTDSTATLVVGRMPLTGNATIVAVNAPDIDDVFRLRAPYLEVDQNGVAHLFYLSQSTLKIWYVTFGADNQINVEPVNVALDTQANSFIIGSSGDSLRAARQTNGKIHVLLQAQIDDENSASRWAVHHGVFIPNSGRLSARAVITSFAPQDSLSNLVVFSPQ